MKNYQVIDKAIREVGEGRIVCRRRNPALSVILILAGVAAALSVWVFGVMHGAPVLAYAIIFTGALMVVFGILRVILYRNTRRLYYMPSGAQLRRYELMFDTPYLMKVCQFLDEGDLEALSKLPHGRSSSVRAVIYKSVDDGMMCGQAFGYQKPLTETKFFERGNFTRLERLA